MDVWKRSDLESFLHDAIVASSDALLLTCTGLRAFGNGVQVKIVTDCVVSSAVEPVRRVKHLVDFLSHQLLVGRTITIRQNTDSESRDQGLEAVIVDAGHDFVV